MKRIINCFIVLTILHSIAFAQNPPIIESPGVSAKIKLFESWVEAQMKYYNLPGLTMGIIQNQELIWKKGFGFADLQKKIPTTPQSIFRIASITKLFTSTAIMQLRDGGKLHLDDPVIKYLPWFKIKDRFPDAPEITIRHFLTHTSGIPREAAFPYWTDHKFPTIEQIKEELPNQETIFPSETKFKYSNLAMALLGQIVVAASGEEYESYIINHILKPLGMNNTSVTLSDKDKQKLVTGYGIRLPNFERKHMPYTESKGLTPAANMSSNVEDLAKFISLQFREEKVGGNQILKSSTLKEMQRVHWLKPSWSSGWGLGFSIRKYGKRTLVGHGGWVAGNRTQIYFCSKEKIGVVVMSNSEDGSPSMFARKIFDVIIPAINKTKKSETKKIQSDPSWQKYVGKYQDSTNWESLIMILNNELVLYGFDYPPEDNPESAIVKLTPEGKHTFRMTGENGNGELLIFQMDQNGNVKQIKKGENYLYPVGIGE
jgi:CubicO group peptidase (beta-lactamase class C family)